MSQKTPMIAAAGFIAIALTGYLISAAPASARSLNECTANSRDKVIECCKQAVKNHRPQWMITNNSSCQRAAACTTKWVKSDAVTYAAAPKKVVVCHIVASSTDGGDKTRNPPPKTDKPEDPNPNTSPDPNTKP